MAKYFLLFPISLLAIDAQAAAPDAEKRFALSQFSEKCRKFVADLPKDTFWNVVTVPEDRERPKGNQVSVFYYGRMQPGEVPVLFLNGGPTQTSQISFKHHEAARAKQRPNEKISFIYMDQRGTGCSSGYPSGLTAQVAERLTNYGSRDIVADAETIRGVVLGEKPWGIYGHSYGGNIVARYLMLHPENVAFAFSFAGATFADLSDLRLRFEKQQELWARYAREYPDDAEKLKRIRARIPTDYCVPGLSIKLCGADGLDVIAVSMGFPHSWPMVHKIIVSMDEAGESLLQVYADTMVNVAGSWLAISGMPGNVISWRDTQGGYSDYTLALALRKSFLRDGIAVDSWPVSELRLFTNVADPTVERLISQLRRDRIDSLDFRKIAENLKRFPALPSVWVAGADDAIVSPETVENTVRRLKAAGAKNVELVVLPNVGHSGDTLPEVLSKIKKAVDSQ